MVFIVGAFIPAVGLQVRSPDYPSSEKSTPTAMVDSKESKDGAIAFDSVISESKDLLVNSCPDSLGRADPWWNSNWSYRKKITIDHTKVIANLTNFPVLISLPSDADLAAHTQDDGDDLVFISTTGVKLNHEIEYFNDSTGR
ncbi:MAG TPA: hypothetical protein VMY59_04725, partial [Candidatus Thermoplasmatota archaeon]|nr:hypothetical protein [Candidatus Thermoplasmatota archaeon]